MTSPSLTPATILTGIPPSLRAELVDAYNDILSNFIQNHWVASELNGGKLCEIVYTILKGLVDGSFPASATKPANMVDACRALEHAPSTFSRSVRIQIPRMLIALYEIRNNRGVGHVGSDVDPNHMDATAVLYMAKWIISELIRLFHSTDTATATAAVDLLVETNLPTIWVVDGKYRVLDTSLNMISKTLLVLSQVGKEVSETDLFSWVEHSNPSIFRRDILKRAHAQKLIEYNSTAKTVRISPKGIDYVHKKVPLKLIEKK
jgi:hypothetical protein